MSQITELVDLPDPTVQRLVHPLDLPNARGRFRTAWLISTFTSPLFGLCFAAIIWFGSRSYVVPLVAGAAIIGFGALAGRFFSDEAWAFIPRKRQDRHRPLPVPWQIGSGLLLVAVLTLALLLVAFRLREPDVSSGVREVTFGMGAAVGLLVLVDSLRRFRRDQRTELWGAVPTLFGLLAISASIATAYIVLFGSSGPESVSAVVIGAGAMLAVGVGVGVWKYLESRIAIKDGEIAGE